MGTKFGIVLENAEVPVEDERSQISEWARAMGVSETALREFLSAHGDVDSAGHPQATTADTAWFGPEETVAVSGLAEEPSPSDPTETVGVGIDVQVDVDNSGERYEDLGRLGLGGIGDVRKVRDHKLGRLLAMKIIHRELMDRPSAVNRFIEEAQVEAQLQHPNIVPVHDIGRLPDGRHYFTMQRIRGVEFSRKIAAVHEASGLSRWRPADDGTSFRDLILIIQQVCETVAYAHSKGVVHRDLKPENIMIGEFGEVQVVDWGLAKVLGSPEDVQEDAVVTQWSAQRADRTRVGTIAGTPRYMAPEQAMGHTADVGPGTDVYTLGTILYEVLSGSSPFQGSSVAEVLALVKRSSPGILLLDSDENSSDVESSSGPTPSSDHDAQPSRAMKSRIPRPLAELCEAAMVREVSERRLTAREMAHALKDWLEGAEKRDRALREVAYAATLDQAQVAQQTVEREWLAADALLTFDTIDSEDGWHTGTRIRTRCWTSRYCGQDRSSGLYALVHALASRRRTLRWRS